MYVFKYNIKESGPCENAVSNKVVTGKGKIEIRIYDDVPPAQRKRVRTRIDNLFSKDSTNYLRFVEKFEKPTGMGHGKNIDGFYVHIEPSKTLLTKLRLGLGIDLNIISNRGQALEEIINIEKLHNYLLVGESKKK